MTDQAMLSTFGAGDTDDLDLSYPADGVDLEAKRDVEAYAEDVAAGGWEFCALTTHVNFWNPDGNEVYRLERTDYGWRGKRGSRAVEPSRTGDLQEALDRAGEWMAENPVERDRDE